MPNLEEGMWGRGCACQAQGGSECCPNRLGATIGRCLCDNQEKMSSIIKGSL